MIHRPSNPRRNLIPYAALLLVLVVGAGGGYAFAASKTKTITVCADKKTGILHLHNHGKCKRSQTRVSLEPEGPAGPTGRARPRRTAGRARRECLGERRPMTAQSFRGRALSVQHVSAGTYQVTITAPACAHGANAPVVTVADANPPGGQTAGAFPVAWYARPA